MNFAGFVCSEAIRADLKSNDKQGVILEMVQALADAGQIPGDQYKSVVKAILKREALGSTGLGQGVAISHTKHSAVDRTLCTAGLSAEGVDFASLDGERVHFFVLLISLSDRPDEHVSALEKIARQLREDVFCRLLTQAKTAEDIKQLLDECDHNQF